MTFEAVIRASTDKAYKFDILLGSGAFKQIWAPRSVCKSVTKFPTESGRYRQAQVVVEDWWAEKNGLL